MSRVHNAGREGGQEGEGCWSSVPCCAKLLQGDREVWPLEHPMHATSTSGGQWHTPPLSTHRHGFRYSGCPLRFFFFFLSMSCEPITFTFGLIGAIPEACPLAPYPLIHHHSSRDTELGHTGTLMWQPTSLCFYLLLCYIAGNKTRN